MEMDEPVKWLFLTAAIAFEVAGTTMMKLSEGFTKPWFSIAIFICYVGSLTFLTMTLKYFEIGVVYAIWSGVGIAVISILGMLYFHEKTDFLKMISLILVILGVVGLNLAVKP